MLSWRQVPLYHQSLYGNNSRMGQGSIPRIRRISRNASSTSFALRYASESA